MRFFSFLVAAFVLLLPAPMPSRAQEAPATVEHSPPPFEVFGYHAWWMRDQWQAYDWDVLDELLLFELRVQADGTLLYPEGWPDRDLLAHSRAAGVPAVPTVTLFDHAVFVDLFGDPDRLTMLREAALAAVRATGGAGLHLDVEVFEPVPPLLRDNLTRFMRSLRGYLDRDHPGARLSLFMPAFDHGEAYDERALAEVADRLVVQGYDLHWRTAPTAGPVATLRGWEGANWDAIVQRYLELGVPRKKIIMAVPYYGYEWPTESAQPGAATRGEGREITYVPVDSAYLPWVQVSAVERLARYGARRDTASGSPYYAYQGEDGWYQGWYEDAESLRAKYAYVQAQRLGGVALFPLGYDGGRLTDVLRTFRR